MKSVATIISGFFINRRTSARGEFEKLYRREKIVVILAVRPHRLSGNVRGDYKGGEGSLRWAAFVCAGKTLTSLVVTNRVYAFFIFVVVVVVVVVVVWLATKKLWKIKDSAFSLVMPIKSQIRQNFDRCIYYM